MFQNAKFFLVSNASLNCQRHPERPPGRNPAEASRQVLLEQCLVTQTTADHINIESCRALQIRLDEQLPSNEWELKVEFNDFHLEPFHQQEGPARELSPGDILVSGQILEKLHSIMLYNTEEARLKLKLTASLIFEVSGQLPFHLSGHVGAVIELKYETELFPRSQDGHLDHSSYSAVWRGPTTSITSKYDLTNVGFYSQICSLNISVEGVDFSFSDPLTSPIRLQERYKKALETGFCSDIITIIAKDGVEIPCHKMMLCAQSPVLETMLMGSNYVEAKTREIPMPDRSKNEVMAFLEYLYCGSLSKTVDDIQLALNLYEMGHYYDVKHLEKETKWMLLSRSEDSFDVEAALRLFNFACGSGDADLKLKAADVLEGKTHDAIFSSEVYKLLSPEVAKELPVKKRKFRSRVLASCWGKV